MMSGGFFMFGLVAIAMVLVIGLPIVLIVVLIWALTQRGKFSTAVPAPVFQSSASARSCSHCGAALQAGWSHCPQCGAPV